MLTGQCKNSRLAHKTVYEDSGGKLRRPALQKFQTCSQDGVCSQNGVCSQDSAKTPDLLTRQCMRTVVDSCAGLPCKTSRLAHRMVYAHITVYAHRTVQKLQTCSQDGV